VRLLHSRLIITARALLDTNPEPDEAEIREAISGNVCRCTGYVKIIQAIQRAAAEERAGAHGAPAGDRR
jgi:carbon-monoxide dehydrogenase small subunit